MTKTASLPGGLATATCGGLLFYLMPLLPIFETSEITPKTLQWTALAGGFIILPTVLASIIVLPSKGASNAQNKQREHKLPNSSEKIHKCHRSDSDDSRIQLSVLIDNKPLLLFLFALLFTGMAIGMLLSLLFIFIDSYLKMGQHYALATLLSMAASIVSLKFWVVLATKLGKQFAWGTGAGIVVVGTLIMAVLQPGEVSFSLLLLLTSLLTCGAAAGGVLAPSFLSEIIDYSRWKYKADCSASYFSLYTLMIKTNAALGAALGFSIAGLYGFDPSSDAYSLDSIFGLRLAVIWFPAAIALLSIVFISQIPMTTRRYSIIRRRLDGRVGPVSCSENIGVPVEKRSLIEDSNSV